VQHHRAVADDAVRDLLLLALGGLILAILGDQLLPHAPGADADG